MEIFQHFLTILIPLIIITDPPGNLPFFLLFTEQNTLDERRKMAAIASSSAALILIFFALTGDFVLRFFNIGLPAFQLAGGFIFFYLCPADALPDSKQYQGNTAGGKGRY
ncbi:MAG: MarC family protein [Proteobacteria bacterium]|nr:MarC family protein [Pseudomonadota bacterium]